ncbi:MAG: V-type ATPase 116kDa subunit family protein [Bianqueaceae bacterium]
MSDSDLAGFQKAVDKFDDTTSIVYEPEEVDERIKTPTKLKNKGVVKAFEALVGMYGVPSYNELDPTPLVTITYLLIFGMMFGDVGQGLVIFFGAFFLYKLKGIKLAKVISYCGISSVIFGFVYGSFFGNETIIHSLLPFLPLLEPMQDQLITLGIGLGLGAILIVVAIVRTSLIR